MKGVEKTSGRYQSRNDAGKGEGLGPNGNELDFEEVARLCAFDEDRACQRVNDSRIQFGEIGFGRLGVELPIHRVPSLQYDFLFRICFDDGGNVRMPAVVPRMGLLCERLTSIDFNNLHSSSKRTGFPQHCYRFNSS